MVGTIAKSIAKHSYGPDYSKTEPFKNRPQKCPDFGVGMVGFLIPTLFATFSVLPMITH